MKISHRHCFVDICNVVNEYGISHRKSGDHTKTHPDQKTGLFFASIYFSGYSGLLKLQVLL